MGPLNPGVPFDPALLDARICPFPEPQATVGGRSATPAQPGNTEGGPRLAADIRLAISVLDLTTLAGNDTDARVEALCRKARAPLGESDPTHVAAVCVFPVFVETARRCLSGSPVRVATVAGGFPHGLGLLSSRVVEVADCAATGADEIDVVIRRSLALEGRWEELHDEVRRFREAAADRVLKVILATGELGSMETVRKASMVALAAGADFIKTSTGREAVNATPEAGIAMAAAIRDYADLHGFRAGLKAAGGIRLASEALEWLSLVRRELGEPWANPALFRIGASSLLDYLVLAASQAR